jgi:hypothetical protein
MGGERDRAQLLLVGALALAVVFLSLSLLLNSVIYTENLATRQTHADVEKAETFRVAVVDSLGGAIDHANRLNTTSFTDRRDAYRAATDSLIPILANYSATDGVAAGVDRRGVRRGTRIVDDNASTGIVANDGSASWTMATDSKVRAFRLNVTPASVDQPGDTVLTFENGTTQYVIIEDDGQRQVLVSGVGSCKLGTGRIDIGAATVDGDHCGPLADARLSGPVNVSVTSGDRINATYSLVTDRNQAGLRTAVDTANYPGQCTPSAPSTYASTSADDPYTTPAIYASTARISVATQDLDYGRTVRAAPGETGVPPDKPTFSTYNVTQSGNDFTVDWNSTDPDGVVTGVDIRATYVTNGTLYSETTGAPADGTTTFTDLPSGYEYYINGTVTDGSSTRRITEIHESGGCP